jgi:hypothetical protein
LHSPYYPELLEDEDEELEELELEELELSCTITS